MGGLPDGRIAGEFGRGAAAEDKSLKKGAEFFPSVSERDAYRAMFHNTTGRAVNRRTCRHSVRSRTESII
jgi:hypothetical protein